MKDKATQRRLLREPPSRNSSDGDAECQVECVDAKKVNRARKAQPSAADVATLAETFKTLGDPTRLRIVAALAEEELCVCDIATLLGASQSAVSHSLRALRLLRLVRYRKTGKIAYYTLDDEHIGSLLREGIRHVREAESNEPLTRSRR